MNEVQESPAITMANEKKEGISTDTTKSLPQFAAGCDSGHPGRVDPGRVSIVDAAGGSSLGRPQGRVPWQGGFLPPCPGFRPDEKGGRGSRIPDQGTLV